MRIGLFCALILGLFLCGCTSSTPPVAPAANYIVVDQSFISYATYSFNFEIGQSVNIPGALIDPSETNPIVFSIYPSLPMGLLFNSLTGAITGTASGAPQNQTQYKVIGADSSGKSSIVFLYIQISPSLQSISAAPIQLGSVSSPNPVNLNSFITGGTGSNVFKITSNQQSGTVTPAGIFTVGNTSGPITFSVQDSSGTEISLSGVVSPPSITIESNSSVIEGNSLSVTLTLSGKSSADSSLNYSIIYPSTGNAASPSNIGNSTTSCTSNASPTNMVIAAGTLSCTIDIPTISPNFYNSDLSFSVQISLADSNTILSTNMPAGSIVSGNTVTFPVTLKNSVGIPYLGFSLVTEEFTLADGNIPLLITMIDAITGNPIVSYQDTTVNLAIDSSWTNISGFSIDTSKPDTQAISGSLADCQSITPSSPQVITVSSIATQPKRIVIPKCQSSILVNVPAVRSNINQYASRGQMSFILSDSTGAILTSSKSRINVEIDDPRVIVLSSGTNYALSFDSALLGWDNIQDIEVRIPSGVTLYGTNPTIGGFNTGALTLNSGASLKLINYGTIIGAGGLGGQPQSIPFSVLNSIPTGGTCSNKINSYYGLSGGDGGPAITAITPITVINYGTIEGGGGGGAGGITSIDLSCGYLYQGIAGSNGAGGTSSGISMSGPQIVLSISEDPFSTQGSTGGSLGLPGFVFSDSNFNVSTSNQATYSGLSTFDQTGTLQPKGSALLLPSPGKSGPIANDIDPETGVHDVILIEGSATAVALPSN